MTAVLERLLRPGGRRRSPTRLLRAGRSPASRGALSRGGQPGGLGSGARPQQRHRPPARRVPARRPADDRAGQARIPLGAGPRCRPIRARSWGSPASRWRRATSSGAANASCSALRAYPDFPEARAVLDALAAAPTSATPTAAPASAGAAAAARRRARARRSWTPRAGRSSSVPRPRTPGRVWPAIAGLASAALQARRVSVRSGARSSTTASRRISSAPTACSRWRWRCPGRRRFPQGLLEVNRLWGAVQHELAVARDESARPTARQHQESVMSRLRLALDLEGTSRGRQVRDIVEGLGRLHWVRGALVVSPDGFVIAAEVPRARGGRAAGRAGRDARARSGSRRQPDGPRRVPDGAVLGRRRHGASWPPAASGSSWRWPSLRPICSHCGERSARRSP